MAVGIWTLVCQESAHQVTYLNGDRHPPKLARDERLFQHTYSLVLARVKNSGSSFHFHTDQGVANAYLSQDEADKLAGTNRSIITGRSFQQHPATGTTPSWHAQMA